MLIQFVVWSLVLYTIGFFIIRSKRPEKRTLLLREWRISEIYQTPDPIDALDKEARDAANAYLKKIKENGFIRFHREGHYVVDLFRLSTGLWELEGDRIHLINDDEHHFLRVDYLASNQLELSWSENGITIKLKCRV